jgi:hypothetical protein
LAAIQGLNQKLEAKDAAIEGLNQKLEEKDSQKDSQIQLLEHRLDAVEKLLQTAMPGKSPPLKPAPATRSQ